MTVLLTGGAGFLGRRILLALLRRNATVRCHVRSAEAEGRLRASLAGVESAAVECVTGNLLSDVDCERLVEGCGVVVHAAAAKAGSPSALFLNTVSTTRALTTAAVKLRVPRIVLVSSLGVYGTATLKKGDALTEDCPIEPRPELRDGYSFSKIAQENLCRTLTRGSATGLVVIRPGVIYGPGGDLLSGRVGLKLGSVLLVMGGRHQLPYTYVDNCADAIALSTEASGVEGQTFNVIDSELPTGRTLAREYSRRVARLRIITLPQFTIPMLGWLYEAYGRRSDDLIPPILTRYRCDAQWKPLRYPNTLATRHLGWNPRAGLAEAVERTIESLRPATATSTMTSAASSQRSHGERQKVGLR